MTRRAALWTISLVAICFWQVAFADTTVRPKIIAEFTGKVVGISDGDTLTVLHGREQVKIRLQAIDAPEKSQEFGEKSKQALSAKVFGKVVTVKKTGEDRYGRTLAFVTLGDVEVNLSMLADGWAWHFKEYNTEPHLAKLEAEARAGRKGLWAGAHPLAPWEFRARQRTPKVAGSAATPDQKFWLNTNSNVRHNSKCEHFGRTSKGRYCGPTDGKACGICGG